MYGSISLTSKWSGLSSLLGRAVLCLNRWRSDILPTTRWAEERRPGNEVDSEVVTNQS